MRLRTFPMQSVLRAGAVQPSGSENHGAVSVKSGAGGVVPPSRARGGWKPARKLASTAGGGTAPSVAFLARKLS
jgi:hypothetical protein